MVANICWWVCIVSAILLGLFRKKVFWIPLLVSLLFFIRETCRSSHDGFDFTQSGQLAFIALATLAGGRLFRFFLLEKIKFSNEEAERKRNANIGYEKLVAYNEAIELSKSNSYKDIEAAIERFSLLDGWKDSNQQIELLRERLEKQNIETTEQKE